MQQKNPPPRSSVANKMLWCLMPWGHVLLESGPLKQVWHALLPLPHVLEHSLSSGQEGSPVLFVCMGFTHLSTAPPYRNP